MQFLDVQYPRNIFKVFKVPKKDDEYSTDCRWKNDVVTRDRVENLL